MTILTFIFAPRNWAAKNEKLPGRAIFPRTSAAATALNLSRDSCSIMWSWLTSTAVEKAPLLPHRRRTQSGGTVLHRHLRRQRRPDGAQAHPGLLPPVQGEAMPPAFRIIGFARREKTDDSWRDGIARGAGPVLPHQAGGRRVWQRVRAEHLFYCQGDLTDAAAYTKLEEHADLVRQRAAAAKTCCFIWPRLPSQFGEVVEQLHRAGLLHKERRRAGSGSWSRSPSATTWLRRTR